MKAPDTQPAKSAKSALSSPPAINADNADIAGALSARIKKSRAAGLTLTNELCVLPIELSQAGHEMRSVRAMRQYIRAVDLFISIERNLEGLP
jgi:hypothetical protein